MFCLGKNAEKFSCSWKFWSHSQELNFIKLQWQSKLRLLSVSELLIFALQLNHTFVRQQKAVGEDGVGTGG